jgi:hypothetical protein
MLFVYFILVLNFYCSDTLDTHTYCHPVDCADGSCYCTDRRDGWFNGGGFCSKDLRNCECTCDNAGTSCQNRRCPDDWTQAINWQNDRYAGLECFRDDPVKGRIYSEWQWFDFCYRTRVACDYGKCPYGESLTGCARISPGSCTRCPELTANRYWASKGSCIQNTCSVVTGGKFAAKPCTTTTDTVIANCSTYPGNRDFIVPRQDGRSTYYCPGGGLVLLLPENSEPTPDYSNFVCVDGFYLNGATCLPCVPGSACKYGKKYTCPMHYYTSSFAMSSCTKCSSQCGEWAYPVRCNQGSTANLGCVPCGGCSYDPKRGLSCVTESYEMQGLPVACIPSNVDGDVAVCL